MNIVIDANIFIECFLMTSTSFKTFLDGLKTIEATLYVPEIILSETINKYEERLRDAKNEIDKSFRTLGPFIQPRPTHPVTDDYVDQAIAEYERHFKDRLVEVGAIFVDYPDISHREVVERELQRKKPFTSKGKGYRDFLIWMTVLEIANTDGPVFFVTNNHEDFAVSRTERTLHRDLGADLTALGLPESAITLFYRLDDFNQDQIIPKLEWLNMVEEITAGTYEGLDISSEISNGMHSELVGSEFEAGALNLPGDSASFDSVHDVVDYTVTDVHRLPSGELLIGVDALVECEFDVFIHKSEAHWREEGGPTVVDWNWNESFVRAVALVTVRVILRMTFDSQIEEITSFEVGDVDVPRRPQSSYTGGPDVF